jgi:hypothetical protein
MQEARLPHKDAGQAGTHLPRVRLANAQKLVECLLYVDGSGHSIGSTPQMNVGRSHLPR